MNKDSNDILRLNFENFIWIVFITISVLNIIADNDEKKFINANNSVYKTEANNIFELTIFIIFLIYIYFAIRNYNALSNADDSQKSLYSIKFIGSIFLVVGSICLIYFQKKQANFMGSPA